MLVSNASHSCLLIFPVFRVQSSHFRVLLANEMLADRFVPDMPAFEEPAEKSRMIIVANRLPITVKRDSNGNYDFIPSSGGPSSSSSSSKLLGGVERGSKGTSSNRGVVHPMYSATLSRNAGHAHSWLRTSNG